MACFHVFPTVLRLEWHEATASAVCRSFELVGMERRDDEGRGEEMDLVQILLFSLLVLMFFSGRVVSLPFLERWLKNFSIIEPCAKMYEAIAIPAVLPLRKLITSSSWKMSKHLARGIFHGTQLRI